MIYSGIVFTVFVAVLFTYIYTNSRHFFRNMDSENLRIVIPIMQFSSTLYALFATFTISNLWNRYQIIRAFLVQQLNQLRLIYHTIRVLPNTKSIQKDIKLYANLLAREQLQSLAKNQSNQNVLDAAETLQNDLLLYQTDSPLKMVVLNNLYLGEFGKQLLTNTINKGLYAVLLFTALLVLAAFWFLNIVHFGVQFALDLIVIIIIGLTLYIVYEFTNPLDSDLLRETISSIYIDFLAELDHDLPGVVVI